MSMQPGDVEKMARALDLPDAMTKSTGSDIEPEKAAELRRRADRQEAADNAEADDWEHRDAAPVSGS